MREAAPETDVTRGIRLGVYHADHTRRGPNGRFHCKRCGKEVPKGRRAWCSKECVAAWDDAHNAGHQRWVLSGRDREVCQRCGLDTRLLVRILRRLGYHRMRYTVLAPNPVKDLLVALGFRAGDASRTLWEADHVIPLIEGGDPGTRNMRTLCNVCHRDETAALAARRAAKRRTGGVDS